MKESAKKNSLTSLLPLLLFVVFTACMLLVLLTGAKVYRKLADRDADSYQHRTAVQYLATRLHQNDLPGGSFVGSFEDQTPKDTGSTLYLCEELDGSLYYTRIYCYEGFLRELFAEAGEPFQPEDGVKILQAQSVSFSRQEDLLQVELTLDATACQTLYLHLRSGTEVAP